MERNEQARKLGKFLLSGATLLSQSCPDCTVPLVKKDELVFCGICGRKVEFISLDDEINRKTDSYLQKTHLHELESILIGKLSNIGELLLGTNDPDGLLKLIELSERIINLLRLLRIEQRGDL